MTNIEIGALGVGMVLLLLALRVPVGIALGGVSIVGIWMIRGPRPALGFLANDPYEFAASWTLSAVPLFLLLGALASNSGMMTALYRSARLWFAGVPGGLAVGTNIACAGFAAVSGSSVATTAAMGRLAIPEMLKLRYDPALATGVVCAAGTLGALIPPSIAFVVYGWYAEVPVGKLLVAGILPGLLTAAVYAALVIGLCRYRPELAPLPEEVAGLREKLLSLRSVWPIPVIIVGIVGSIYSGIATPTEAAALGAALAMLVAAAQRQLSFRMLTASVADAARTTASLFLIVMGAVLFTKFLALSGLPAYLPKLITGAGLSPMAVLLCIILVYLVLGCFLEGLGIMLLTLPIIVPICREIGIDLIWLGVIVVKMVEIGLLTPPVGMHCFVVKSIVGKDVGMGTIFRGCGWFLAAEVAIMALLLSFPAISLFLPGLLD